MKIFTHDANGKLITHDPDDTPGSIFSMFLEYFTGLIDPRPRDKASVNYHEYIQSDEWKAKAKIVKARAEWRCEICGRSGNYHTLEAHHKTYEHLGNERLSDLQCLCSECHEKISRG
ncbi:5-methylcytosine-specific restriction enzyme A [Gammaproteobacteria bacterium]